MLPSHFSIPKLQRGNAKHMRRMMTEAELKIVDFACPQHCLVVELDGTQHARPEVARADGGRTRKLEADGWSVLRFWSHEVLEDISGVCQHIVNWVEQRK